MIAPAAGARRSLQGERPDAGGHAWTRTACSVGEELTYTLRAVSRSPVPMQVTVAAVHRPRDRLPQRAHRVSLRRRRRPGPRCSRSGCARCGPAAGSSVRRARCRARDTVEAGAVVVDVAASRAATASTLNPRLRQLLERAPPPLAGQAGRGSARVGRHGARGRAGRRGDRRLVPARPAGPAAPPADAAAAGHRRRVELSPGRRPRASRRRAASAAGGTTSSSRTRSSFRWCRARSAIPRATLKYSTPVALQFFSQEERFALTSRAGDAGGAPAPRGRPARRLHRRDRHGAQARAAGHARGRRASAKG